MKTIEGNFVGKGRKFAIVVARFNEFLTKQLLEGALEGLRRHEVAEKNITVAWVPGSFEIPVTALSLAKTRQYDAIICLGAVIRGETPHFEHVSREAASGINQVGLMTGLPVIFGVLTTDNLEQAVDRAGVKAGNKGFEAALTALAMADVIKQIKT